MSPRPVDPNKFPLFIQVLIWFADEAKETFLGGLSGATSLAATRGGFFLCLGFFLLSLSATGLTAFSITRDANGAFDIKTSTDAEKKLFAMPDTTLPEPYLGSGPLETRAKAD